MLTVPTQSPNQTPVLLSASGAILPESPPPPFPEVQGGQGFFCCFLGGIFGHAVWHFSSQTRDGTCSPALEAWNLNHWLTREVLGQGFQPKTPKTGPGTPRAFSHGLVDFAGRRVFHPIHLIKGDQDQKEGPPPDSTSVREVGLDCHVEVG